MVRRENSENTFSHRGDESRPSSWSKVFSDLSSLEMGFSPHSSLENVYVTFLTLSHSQPVFSSGCQNTSPLDFLHTAMFMSTSESSHFILSFLIPFLISKPERIKLYWIMEKENNGMRKELHLNHNREEIPNWNSSCDSVFC